MFRVDNLVFNKIGNSISVMIFLEEKGLQIWDETDFVFLSAAFSLEGICVKDYIEFIFMILYRGKKYNSKLFLSEKNCYLQFEDKVYKVFVEDEKIYIEIDKANILFNLSLKGLKNISIRENMAEIGEKNLFKGIVEFFVETFLIES